MTTRRNRASARPDTGGRRTSYNVRVWKTRPIAGKRRTTYNLRWSVGTHQNTFSETLPTRAAADGRRSELVTAARNGEPFDMDSGLPVSELQAANGRTWYQHALEYVDRRWDRLSANSRKSIAETLVTVTAVLVSDARGRPADPAIREALYRWAFNKRRRTTGEPPAAVARTLAWVEASSPPLAALASDRVMLDVLEALARKLDGTPAAGNTVARKRAVLFNVLEHAVGNGLETNPLPLAAKKWTAPKTAEVVNPQVVVNRKQADALIAVVADQGRLGKQLVAFFGCLYYAGLRPGEAVNLRRNNLDIPKEGWGTLILATSAPSVARGWTNTGKRREERQLKHRADADVRLVPCAPPLTALLRRHLEEFGVTNDGRLFRGEAGGELSESVYGRVWDRARAAALNPTEVASPLAKRPYDLRHACLSTWLNATGDPTQVAEWAGNTVNVLLRVYAKCIVGRDRIARQRIEEALRKDEPG